MLSRDGKMFQQKKKYKLASGNNRSSNITVCVVHIKNMNVSKTTNLVLMNIQIRI